MNETNHSDRCGPLVPQWVERLCQGQLDDQDAAQLEQCVISDPAARRYYLRYLHLHASLPTIVASATTEGRPAEAVQARPKLPLSLLGFFSAASRVTPGGEFMVGVLLVAVVVGAFAGLAIILQSLGNGQPAAGFAHEQGPPRLIAASHCQWHSHELEIGGVVDDKPLELDAGLARFKLDDYVEVLVEGPARLKVLSPRRIWLAHGKLVATALSKGAGFTVLTPHAEIIDLGTEFGVETSADGQTQVKVFQGMVRIEPRSGEAAPARSAFVIRAGEARQISFNQQTGRARVSLPPVGNQFVRSLEPPVSARTMLTSDEVVVEDSGVQWPESIERSLLRPAADDLLQTALDPWRPSQPASDSTGVFPGQQLAALFDGRLYQGPNHGDENHTGGSFTAASGQSLDFYFDARRQPQGYDIARVESTTGWQLSRMGQQYSVFVRFVGDHEFEPRPVATVRMSVDPTEANQFGEYRVSIYPRSARSLASRVDAIRFIFHDTGPDDRPGSVYREIDVFGAPSAAGP